MLRRGGKSPNSANRAYPRSLWSAYPWRPAAQFIISCPAVSWLGGRVTAFSFARGASDPSKGRYAVGARGGFLRDLLASQDARNLFLAGHFFLPCCIQ